MMLAPGQNDAGRLGLWPDALIDELHGLHEGTRTLVAHALAWVLAAVRDRLSREVALSQDTVCLFLDDFTTSDLRAVRLSDDVDVERLRARSDVIGGGDGFWVIRSGPTGVRDLADR
ncbi:hypothetical protein AB0K18_37295 [Nonomuraea sp. NPDC049421]|uniref:hypothetical protein n=1 Tax=Nonomuraea sp. NPDC049421 TaxID=3155275 RepID=UPI003421DC8F